MYFVWIAIYFLYVTGLVALVTICPNAYVLTKLWFWFVSPIFHVQKISFAQAFGLVLITNLLQHQSMSWRQIQTVSKRASYKDVLLVLSKPALSLLIGWIAHLFL